MTEEMIQLPEDVMTPWAHTFTGNVPVKARCALILKSFGLSDSTIADQLSLSPSTVKEHLRKFDAGEIAGKASQMRKLFISAMFEAVSVEILATIKAEDVKSLPLAKKLELARMCVGAIKDLKVAPVQEVRSSDKLVGQIKEMIEDNDILSEGAGEAGAGSEPASPESHDDAG